MRLWLLTLAFGAVSSVIPVFNMEAYILVVLSQSRIDIWPLAFIGSLGQNVGKLVWYYACRGAIKMSWMEAKLSSPRRQQQFLKWSEVVRGRPLVGGGLSFISAAIGFPPFFAMAMIAGSLRIPMALFFLTGLIGRTLFFAAILGGGGLLLR